MDQRQQILLDDFYSKQKIWWPDYFYGNIVAMICLPIAMMLLIVPYQVWEGDHQILGPILLLELMGLEMYVKRYYQFQEGGKNKKVCDVLQYLPVSRRQIVLYGLKKLIRICLYLTGGAALCQSAAALLFWHSLSPENIGMPVLCCLVIPLLILGPAFWGRVQP